MDDVVVVGAGSAGAVLAAGLSADPGRRVLLLPKANTHLTAVAVADRLVAQLRG